MKKIKELEQDILDILMKIHHKFPELSKYIAEMPQDNLGKSNGEIDVKSLKEYYNSLKDLLVEYEKSHNSIRSQTEGTIVDFPRHYPPSDDLFIQGKEETELNPEDLSKRKSPNEKVNTPNEKGFKNHKTGDDLDIPGAELDDDQEKVGNEDEENNYYSLGGDSHNDLEEDNG